MTPTRRMRQLLLVDDDEFLCGMATIALEHAGFATTVARAGDEALRLIGERDFDLVLLDVMMPGMDGFEACRRIRAMPRGATLPILMLTGLNDTASVEKAFQCGATDFVTKPINWTLLGHRIRYSLRARDAAEANLRISDQLEAAQRLASLGSWEWSPETGQLSCSRELLRILGREDTPARDIDPQLLLEHVCAEDRETVAQARTAAVQSGQAYELRFAVVRTDGQRRMVHEKAIPQCNGHGVVDGINAITQDITDRLAAEERINDLAFRDGLTGLPNRQGFLEAAATHLERTRATGGQCAVLYLDLDRFRTMNDILGRSGGDQLLRDMAERLCKTVQPDEVGGGGQRHATRAIVARAAGNGFAILLAGIGGEGEAAEFCARVQAAIAEPVKVGEYDLAVTASVGTALFPRDAASPETLLQRAEHAMFAAKSTGSGQQRFFSEAMNRAASSRVSLEHELRRAIAADELCLFFQPKVDARDGSMTGAEALVRWQHPARGLVPPAEFIPLAEESGLIVPLSDWVLRASLEFLRRWTEAGMRTVPLSINISSPLFMQRDFVQHLQAVARAPGVASSQIVLELTETLLMADLERTTARLREIKTHGFGLSLDDFGTGFSSLGYLNAFPIDELKIDRSFVRDMVKPGPNRAIASAIIDLGRQFGLDVVAEGVETAEQSARLLQLGCTLQQGFLFSRPMPAGEFEAALARGATFGRAAA